MADLALYDRHVRRRQQQQQQQQQQERINAGPE
ncbi:hypothetical protein THAOC_37270, partial [Thalassiosira oceanica]